MTDYGHADADTEYGRAIVQYVDIGDDAWFEIFANFDPDFDVGPNREGWEMAVYDGDTKRAWGVLRHTLRPARFHYPNPSVVVTGPDGEEYTTEIADLMLEALHEVDPDAESPFPPDFSSMTDREIIDYVEGPDNFLTYTELQSVEEFVRKGYITRGQATALIMEYIEDNL